MKYWNLYHWIAIHLIQNNKKYTIIFEDENGNELSTQDVVYGESAKEPEAPA